MKDILLALSILIGCVIGMHYCLESIGEGVDRYTKGEIK